MHVRWFVVLVAVKEETIPTDSPNDWHPSVSISELRGTVTLRNDETRGTVVRERAADACFLGSGATTSMPTILTALRCGHESQLRI